jgi:hypothetical protein
MARRRTAAIIGRSLQRGGVMPSVRRVTRAARFADASRHGAPRYRLSGRFRGSCRGHVERFASIANRRAAESRRLTPES